MSQISRAQEFGTIHGHRSDEAVSVSIEHDGQKRLVLQYQRTPPEDVELPVESGCYFHPLATPSGIVVTDVAPADHPHHRGIFLGWVEMHAGNTKADFWGWGEHAPTRGRAIVNRDAVLEVVGGAVTPAGDARGAAVTRPSAQLRAVNDWMGEDERLLQELLEAHLRIDPEANVLDLEYTLTPDEDLTLARWAFSGFCVRVPKAAALVAMGPDGKVELPNPSHLEPQSDWPSRPWYAYTLEFPDRRTASVAVITHPDNPPELWHNHRDVRMLNPCIVAPGRVRLEKGKPLVLRYRVVAADGATSVALLNRLAGEFRAE